MKQEFTLRNYRKGDEMSLQKNINDRNIYRFTSKIPYPYTITDAKKWVESFVKFEKKKDKKSYKLAIDINGGVAGGVGFDPIEGHKAEIGYWLARRYWNNGIMTKAVGIFTKFGFGKLKLKRITAHVFSKNIASVIVLEKNGYKFEGILRKHELKDGKYFDSLLYAKVR